ncbi:reverse transcriptase-like protein [Candidatus Saccharibacteria bacterium]|nr:reverse transcriptase-like protein [Candidatus Saccharibacteria bacterium]
MKTLKLDHKLAELVLSGEKKNTWRLKDDKNLTVNDDVELIDKVDPERPETWQKIGVARITKILEKRLQDIQPEDQENHEVYGSRGVMIQVFRNYYGEDVNENSPVKMIDFTFSAYPKPRPIKETQMSMIVEAPEKIKLFADGGSRGNPGPSASGFVLLDLNDEIITKRGEYIGITTNNQAEYQALKFGLEEAKKLGVQEVDVYLDSLLVVNQMIGKFKVKNRDLWPVYEAIKELCKQFKKVTFTHVPREMNKIADGMVNETLDAQ